MYLNISKAARFLGISISTLRRWERIKKVVPDFRTKGGHRRYCIKKLKAMIGVQRGQSKKLVIGYARVSSHDQKKDLTRQVKRLEKYLSYDSSSLIIKDLGSGMNYKKKGLNKLLKFILSGQVSKIVLTHKDRLLRFGYELIFKICDFFGVQVEVIGQNKKLSDEQILAFDVLEIITVFSARLYGKRSHQNKKAVA